MPRLLTALLLAFTLIRPAMADTPAADEDPYLWLEEVEGAKALAWVRERNAAAEAVLEAREGHAERRARIRALLDAKDRIPAVARRGEWLYNFWQDEKNRRGLWRRTTLEEYRKPEPAWETVLDLDALAEVERENWVWGGSACLAPAYRRCLLMLSRGGADAKVVREFDTVEKRFVTDGFTLPEAKSDVDWIDADTLYVATDFGPGTLTDSGYPRITKRWKRGTPLADAPVVFEGERRDVAAGVVHIDTPGHQRTLLERHVDFYRTLRWLLVDGKPVKLDVPEDAAVSFMASAGVADETLLITLRSDWTVGRQRYASGTLLAADARGYLRGERRFVVLFEPTPTRSLAGYATTRQHVIVNVLDNVTSRLVEWRRDGRIFTQRDIEAPRDGTLGVSGLHDPALASDPLAEAYLLSATGFLTPDALQLARTGSDAREPLKALPAAFDAEDMRVEQVFATSRDGTKVPYFVVWPKGAEADASNPTLLYGYGGFRVPLRPGYSRINGNEWLARGGVYVIANIRGGGEYGPAWHQAAVKADKQKSYDDFIAVAEDLIARRVTSPTRLGIEGGSNGGLLVGAVAVQRPDLFGAVLCQVPLLDMKRYHKLLAGASWMAEYGDPDKPEEWAWISRYSPYQNVRRDAHYPRIFFTTSTRDDRVHPGHARKMAARMLEQGHDVLYWENMEGGHGGAADNEQRAKMLALEFDYLWMQLGR